MLVVLYFLACVLQPICLPVPEMVTILWGSSLTSPGMVFFLGVLGTCIGIAIMYEIACRFMGHMSQKKGFSEKITQFQQYIRDYRFLMIGILFIIPVMPDEIICAGAAVTGIKRSQLLSVAVCGKAVSIGMVVWGREIGQIFALNQYEVMGIEIVLLLLAAKLFQKRHPYEGEKCM